MVCRPGSSAEPASSPGIARDLVVDGDAGIAIDDESGLDAVTMQRVADRIGATKMALYRHVPGKAELTALMLDRALGRGCERVLDGVGALVAGRLQ